MGGGLMQLVAYGAQDVYLTGNPQITFFKVVYRRHTNFSMESIRQTLSGTANFGSRVTSTISRNGDLVGKMYLQVDNFRMGNNQVNLCANIGTALINEVEVEIGGQSIDKHDGHWMETWLELTTPNLDKGINRDISATENGQNNTTNLGQVSINNNTYDTQKSTHRLRRMANCGGVLFDTSAAAGDQIPTFYVPLQFWFNRHAGLALPLIALQYHEVKINLTFASQASVAGRCAGGR